MSLIEDDNLLQEFREKTRCEWCGRRSWTGLDPAHIFNRGLGGGFQFDVPINLVALCRLCHCNSHAGHSPTRNELLEIAAKREKTTVDEIQAEIWRLRRTDKFDSWKLGT